MLSSATFGRAVKAGEHPQDIRITAEYFSYQAGDGSRREYRFSDLSYVEPYHAFVCYARPEEKLQPEIDKSLSAQDARNSIVNILSEADDWGGNTEGFGVKKPGNRQCMPLYFEHDVNRFVDVLNRMIWENSAEMKAQRAKEFEEKVAAWRAAGSKVEVPEEAQRHFVIAQQAFEEKNFQHQAEELKAALEIYPTWPAEQFDVAVVLGELNRYPEAIQHMQTYLALAPDAPDAQRAKQQIWIWQDKTQSAQQAALPAAPAPTRKSRK